MKRNPVSSNKFFILKIIIFSLFIAGSLVCKKEEKPEEVSGTIIFTFGNVHVNEKNAGPGLKVRENDIIMVEKRSAVVIQFMKSAVITVKTNTRITLGALKRNINGNIDIDIKQHSGSTFNKISKGKSRFRIKTPTVVASVRGTSFNINVSKKNVTSIYLLKGRVEVDAGPAEKQGDMMGNNEVILETGHKIEAGEKGLSDVKKINENEKKILQKLDSVAMLPVSELKTDKIADKKDLVMEETEKVMINETELEKAPADSEVKKVRKKITLDDIKKRYGNLSKIMLKSGKTYIGAFNQKGSKMEIYTTDGKISIPVSDIKKVLPY